MASLVQTGIATGSGRMQWALEQRFPKPASSFGRASNLNRLQSIDPEVACVIYCGDNRLGPGDHFGVFFRIEPSPLQPRFVLELRFGPANKQTVIAASFSAYDDLNGNRQFRRTPHLWTGTHGNVAPRGPLDFSRQLYQVMYRTGADQPAAPVNFRELAPGAQLNFSWLSDTCVRYGFGCPRAGLQRDVVQAIDNFKAILDQATTRGTRLGVVTKNSPRIPTLFWPWFCCQPSPSVASWWPWLRPLNLADPGSIMDFSTSNFELDSAYISKAFAHRPEGWNVPDTAGFQDVNSIPEPLVVDKLQAVHRFTDHREYLAHVLGSHGYEDVADKNNVAKYYNGDHRVDVYPDDQTGSLRHLILLNIRAPNADEALPEPGERVLVTIIWTPALGEEKWPGHVIRIPAAYERFGRNVAIDATRPPVSGGRVLGHQRKLAHIFFGHSGAVANKLRAKAIEIMTGGDSFWRSWLLAQDNYSLDNTARTDDLPRDWQQKVDAAIARAHLNVEQAQAVRNYFQHKVTIVVGPPGTGKSTLVDVILSLEEAFNCPYWVCTDSNAGVDVLAKKLCARHGTTSPPGFFRVRTMFDERFVPSVSRGNATGQRALPSTGPVQPTPLGAIGRYLDEADNEIESRPMSLETTIHARMADVLDRGSRQMWQPEKTILQDLRHATNYVTSLRQDGNVALTGDALNRAAQEEDSARNKAIRKLAVVQGAYTKRSRGIFSTAAAASGPTLAQFAPHGLVMDEASQFKEACAIHPILHAHSNGNLRRVLMIGDHHQLPPVLKAERNPFSATGTISLMERQILAGTAHIQLREQFRMHPSISRVVSLVSYENSLVDNAVTGQRPEVDQFKRYMRQIAADSGLAAQQAGRLNTCSFVFSPAPFTKEFPHFGSQSMPGSLSRYNLQTAMMVFRKVCWLIKLGGFKPEQILVTAFYAKQVGLLRSLFQDEPLFNGLRLGGPDSLQLSTVDGSQGEENMVQVIDCVTLGGGANESMGFLGGDKRRFNVAMSRAKVGRIVICHRDFIKGKNHGGAWKQFFADPQTVILGDAKFRTPWESTILRTKFDEVRKAWVASAGASNDQQVTHRNAQTGELAMVTKLKEKDVRWAREEFVRLTGTSMRVALECLTAANGEMHVAIERYYREHGDDNLDGVVEEIERLNI